MKICISLLALMLLINRVAAAEEGFALWHGVQRISYETATLSQDERMGLAGFQYLVDIAPRLYTGLGVFSAVAGDRGGFFTGGFEAGMRQPIAGAFSIDTGLFLGGGGGRSALQGGGLMIRPHLGLVYDFEDIRIGFAYALVDFPNGDIRSSHAAFFLDVPFDALRLTSDSSEDLAALLDRASQTVNRPVTFNREHLVARYTVYSPPDSVMSIGGEKTGTVQLTGFEYSRDLNKRMYLFVEASGASGGRADGYADFFFGGGYRVPLSEQRLFLDGRISAGAGGGGGVDTGGGGAGKASLGLRLELGDELSVDTRAGYEVSAGTFRAKTMEFGLSYAFDAAAFGRNGMPHAPAADELQIDSWRARFFFQQYTSRKASMRKDGETSAISLLGAKIDKFIGSTRAFYLTGQAQSAFDGGAGGYSVGLMGIGYLSGPVSGTGAHVFAEALAGAAGGGGMDVGGGAVIQPLVGVLYDIGSRAGIEASVGRVKALHGALDSTIAGVSLVYRFSTAGRKIGSREELSEGPH